ncbi:MAG: hypothetical protein KUG73_05620 [Pseudomonadales bacterium]|nr:hypothetical protein [Pseudomonadales bacterium]
MNDQNLFKIFGFARNSPDAQILKSILPGKMSTVFDLSKIARKVDIETALENSVEEFDANIFVIFSSCLDQDKELITKVDSIQKKMGRQNHMWATLTRDLSQENLTNHLAELNIQTIFLAPISADEMMVSLDAAYTNHLKHEKLAKRCEQASETARVAMEAASEIGHVMHLVDALAHTNCFDGVAEKVGKLFSALGLRYHLQIFDGHDTYRYSTDVINDSIRHLFDNAAHSEVRIIEHKRLVLLRFDHVIIILINAPWEDSDRYGRVKDLLCQTGPALESRIRTIMVSNLIEDQHEKVMSIMNMMRQLSMDNQTNTRNIMKGLSEKLEVSAMSLDLNEEQEQHLLGLSTEALDSLETLYTTNDALEGHFLYLIDSLTRVHKLTSEEMKKAEDENEGDDEIELF